MDIQRSLTFFISFLSENFQIFTHSRNGRFFSRTFYKERD